MRDRTAFLLAMYKAAWDNINRHLLVVWQSMTALLTALGASYLSGRDLITPDLATTIVVLAAGWSVAHSVDAKGWYNRNLHIITNIERQFLLPEDQHAVHPFFARGPRRSTMIEHLRIQAALAFAIGGLALAQHFLDRVVPGINGGSSFDPNRCLPYVAAIGALGFLLWLHRSVNAGYEKLTSLSRER